MDKEIKTSLANILSLISCAEDYGFRNDVLFEAFAEMLEYKLENEDIERYAMSVKMQDGYTQEDYDTIKKKLTDFQEEYCKNKHMDKEIKFTNCENPPEIRIYKPVETLFSNVAKDVEIHVLSAETGETLSVTVFDSLRSGDKLSIVVFNKK